MIGATDVIDYLIADDNTQVIALFLEGIPAGFAAAAERADRAGKPIVAIKAGSSEVGSAAALAHTGSVAGNDAVVDAALRQLNVIRVDQHRGTADHRRRARLLPAGRAAAGWAR